MQRSLIAERLGLHYDPDVLRRKLGPDAKVLCDPANAPKNARDGLAIMRSALYVPIWVGPFTVTALPAEIVLPTPIQRFVSVRALSLAKSLIDRSEAIESKRGLPAHCKNVWIDWERAIVTRILLAAILCLIPAHATAQTDTGTERDIAAIHHLIEQYAKAVDTVDLNLLSQIWSHSPEVSFIYPLGEEHGFDAIEQQVFQNIMGGMFSARDLEMHGVAIHVSGNAGWSEFHWIFHATMRQEGSAVTTHGVETQVYRRASGKWRLVHVHYSEDRQSVP